MSRFNIHTIEIDDLAVIDRQPIGDSRGFLERMFCDEELSELLGEKGILQINRTLTHQKGSVRGLHFQRPPHAEKKFISCLRGEVFDVAVDLRPESKTFMKWHAEILSGDNGRTFVIPEGFAHGFQTLTTDCELIYFHTARYEATAEGGVHAEDPTLNVQWPLEITHQSDRDCRLPMIDDTFQGSASMKCRHCQSKLTLSMVELGSAPPSNAYLTH